MSNFSQKIGPKGNSSTRWAATAASPKPFVSAEASLEPGRRLLAVRAGAACPSGQLDASLATGIIRATPMMTTLLFALLYVGIPALPGRIHACQR